MNALQDPSKKTSINALLNPQDVSTFSNIPGLASAGPLVASSGHSPNHSTYYSAEYAAENTYNLRAASWGGSDDASRRKSIAQPHMSRYHGHSIQPQHPQMAPQPSMNNYIYAATSRVIRPRLEGSQDYAGDGNMWPQPTQPQPQHHDSSNLSYGPSTTTAMYSDERTALSGDYSSTSDYPPAYDNQPSASVGNPQLWQTTERVSVRLAARGTSAQPVSEHHDERYSRSGYYPSARMYDSSMDQQQQPEQQQLGVSIPPSGPQPLDSIRPSSSTSAKRSIPDSETTPGPKPKRAKAKGKPAGTEPSSSTPIVAPSKRGYNAKKRSEAAFISAQNDALQRAQREGSQRQSGQGDPNRDSYPSDPSNDNRVTGAQYYVPELQFARCMSNRYRNEEFPRCISCTRRWAGDTCRFQGIRYFMRDAQKKLQGISFNEHQSLAQSPTMEFPKTWNRNLEMEHVRRTKLSIAKALLPTLKAEQEHLKAAEIVRRPRESDVRVTCDTCITSLFSTSFMCRLCGREVCNDCFQLVRDLTHISQNPTPAELATFNARRDKNSHANPFFLNCLKRNEHGVNEFTPVTRFVETELSQAINEMEEILAGEIKELDSPATKISLDDTSLGNGCSQSYLEPTDSASKPQTSSTMLTNSHPTSSYPAESFADPLTSPIYDDYTPSNTPEHITSIPVQRLQIIPASYYDPIRPSSPSSSSKPPPAFSALWIQGLPLLVKDVLPRFKLKWTPQYFMDRYGDQTCLIVECKTDENMRITVRDFFDKFGKYTDREKCWKLKDWPPTADFKKTFPELFEDFSQAVPVPDYVRRDGVYNIGSHFPSNAIGPDLGPKMYNAMASSQEVGSKGSTKLHMDMADALNVMLYSTPCEDGNEGYAVWDLYKADDSDKIRAFLKKKFGYGSGNVNGANGNTSSSSGAAKKKTNGVNGQPAANASGTNAAGEKAAATHAVPPAHLVGPDPIHGQQFYLDVELRRQLYDEYGVMSYRVYQRPGDGVFIPAGCAHQVANMSDCIKIAIDFVSPENIDRCERLTKEFREQNQSKVWKEDVLQLRTMMWFAWQSCSGKEKDMNNATRLGS